MEIVANCKVCASKFRTDIDKIIVTRKETGLTNHQVIDKIRDEYNLDINDMNLFHHKGHIDVSEIDFHDSIQQYKEQGREKARLDTRTMLEDMIEIGYERFCDHNATLAFDGIKDLTNLIKEYNKVDTLENLQNLDSDSVIWQLALMKVLEVLQREKVHIEVLRKIKIEIEPILEGQKYMDAEVVDEESETDVEEPDVEPMVEPEPIIEPIVEEPVVEEPAVEITEPVIEEPIIVEPEVEGEPI